MARRGHKRLRNSGLLLCLLCLLVAARFIDLLQATSGIHELF